MLKVMFKMECIVGLICWVLFAVPWSLARGAIDLPRTGQTTSYYAGDDGDLEKGVPWPSPRFVDNGDGTITDELTGLMWVKNPIAIKRTWAGAFDYLKTYGLAGYHDWRMPNVNELESLANPGVSNNATWLSSYGFVLQPDSYWASTTHPKYPSIALGVEFIYGLRSGGGKTFVYKLFLLPVRGTSSGPGRLPKTGQTKCYDPTDEIPCTGTGQDGEFGNGVAWATPRFINNEDGTITDTFTGLMWTEDGETPGPSGCNPGSFKTWKDGLDHIYCLNNLEYEGYLGYTDWRLPNGNELKSLIDYGQTDIATWLNSQGFKNVQPNIYYSSTTPDAYDHSGALTLELQDGGFLNRSKYDGGLIWPVRVGGHQKIIVTPDSIEFGYVAIGTSSAQGVTVQNDGTAVLTLGAIEEPSIPFSRVGGSCTHGEILAPGASCTIVVRFSPTATGPFISSLNIPSNDPDENLKTVILTGTGICPIPGVPANPSPLDGAVGLSVSPTLSWTATSNTDSYDLYFGTVSPPSLVGNVSGTSYPLSGLSTNTTYYWKIVSKNNCGNSTSGPTWSFTSICPTPGAFSNLSPPNGVINQSRDVDLAWGDASGAASYDVYFGTLNPPPFAINTTTSSYDPGTLGYGTTYFWKVVAKNGCGDTAGIIWSFTTIACPMPGTLSNPSPSHNATGVSINPTLSWIATSNTDSYDVYFGISSDPPKVGNVTSPSYPLSGLSANTTYYWKVVAKNNCGNSTSGSVWSFTTLCPTPGTPSGPSPANTATGVPTNPTLGWTATANTDAYDLYFGTVDPPPFAVNVTGTNYPSSGLNTNTTYYWRIVAKNNCGSSTTGPVWSFTTICPLPGAFSYTSPANGSTNQPRDIDLDWEDAPGATSYDVYFGISNPPPFVINKTGSSHDPGTLGYGTTYYWKIAAKNGCGDYPGPVWSFTTCSLPSVPFAPTPSNGSKGISTDSTLTWSSENATSYDVYFGTTSLPPLITTVITPTYDLPPLSYGTTYYWQVVAKNNCGNSTTGSVWSFTTICPTPGIPSSPSPSDGASGISTSPTLTWAAGSNSDSYDIYFGTANPPATKVATTAIPHYFPSSALSFGTTYYWQVVARNDCGNSTPGPIWSFRTRSLEINPEKGTIGTEVTITGSGFGAKKGKVTIGQAALKVIDWKTDTIQVSLGKVMSPETYDVVVTPKEPKGVKPITELKAFIMKGPEITSVEPGGGTSGSPSPIIIKGRFFGSKKGKVTLERAGLVKSCKVLTWTMNVKPGEDQIQFMVPKGLAAAGDYVVKVANKVGWDTEAFIVNP